MYQVCNLIKSLAVYEKCEQECIMTPEVLIKDGFDTSNPPFGIFVADLLGQIVGYTFYYHAYRTNTGKFIHLNDLFVDSLYRDQGIGKKLVQRAAKLANETTNKRLELHCLKWNPALEFYKKIGFINLSETDGWNRLVLNGNALNKHVE
ncbi:hypothetical protein RI129_005507 [Pyrocoelia pectoralis]|uniref:N-acetyltransferase domain-containing protein n=1 Tax=Pyrocoelia pectoralis TaxID=417401 RepID=A0AAN7VL49_9COLE